jgi:hypothetical protein
LRGGDREDFHVYEVELVKTAPGAWLN